MSSLRSTALFDPALLAPGRPYAERAEPATPWADSLATSLARPFRRRPALRAIVPATDAHDAAMRAASDADLLAIARSLRTPLRRDGFTPAQAGRCFALVREAASRTLGLRHFDTQLMAGWALLQGRMVEMHTGEGKTIAATLAASAVALAGYRVHVVTVNGYLAERDAEAMAPLYARLGIACGAVTAAVPRSERPAMYRLPIVYCDNKELAFDYLRDRVAAGPKADPLHRALGSLGGARQEALTLAGLEFAIVDEADSVFIDEARTPLILSANRDDAEAAERYRRALQAAAAMREGDDFLLDRTGRRVRLTQQGSETVAALDGEWPALRAREELLVQALTALHLFHRDIHYVVGDGAVQIVDESTGRLMPDRSWERGLHQLIEAKEGCQPTQARSTIARLTYQRLFRRYLHLSGMTGTGMEVAPEIRRVYGLETVRVPLHRPAARQVWPTRLLPTRRAKWEAVADEVARLALGEGRPVLIGTRSVGASEEISAVLTERGIGHALLNAKQDQDEAAVIAAAGQGGRVTVATNMAGRGTDIKLGPGAYGRGGLHVILTEYHEQRRVDRQLFGRCARQGNPGSCQVIVSLDDEIFKTFAPRAASLFQRLPHSGPRTAALLRRVAQGEAERRAASARVQNLRLDLHTDSVLAFSGSGE